MFNTIIKTLNIFKEAESKSMSVLNINGKITHNQNEIQRAQKEFYSKLYEKQNEQYSSINFFNSSINKLTDINKNKCEGKLTEHE